MDTKKLEVGKYVNTFGIKGEIKVFPYIGYFDKLKKIYIKNEEYEIERVRSKKNILIVKLKDIDDINQIEKFKGSIVTIDEGDRPELPKGKYYVGDLIGMEVYTDDGKLLGTLDQILNTGANDIYQVGEILLPDIPDVIKEIDVEKRRIVVHLLEGLI